MWHTTPTLTSTITLRLSLLPCALGNTECVFWEKLHRHTKVYYDQQFYRLCLGQNIHFYLRCKDPVNIKNKKKIKTIKTFNDQSLLSELQFYICTFFKPGQGEKFSQPSKTALKYIHTTSKTFHAIAFTCLLCQHFFEWVFSAIFEQNLFHHSPAFQILK